MPISSETDKPTLECWAVVAAIAALVPRLRLGTLVCGNTYRHPALLAEPASTVDALSGGRFVLGMGAGWQGNEHVAYGIPLLHGCRTGEAAGSGMLSYHFRFLEHRVYSMAPTTVD